jgi:NDP-sugar pyrophosphorylase family protein
MTIAIIMAAGKGTRMQPLTLTTPKPLAKVGSKTILEINMQKLEPYVDGFVIVYNYLGDQIVDYVIKNKITTKPVHFAIQNNPTGGTLDSFRTGVYFNEDTLSANYIVTNADNIIGDEYYKLLNAEIQINKDQAVFATTYTEDINILTASGVFVTDASNMMTEIVEKSPVFVSNFVNIGLYYLPNQVKDLVNSKRDPEFVGEELITDLFNEYKLKYPIKIISSTDTY